MNRIIFLTPFLLLMLVSSVYATTDIASRCLNNYDFNPAFIYAVNIIASGNGNLQTLGVNAFQDYGNFQMAIYSNIAGVPIQLLANTIEGTDANGWTDLSSNSAITITAGTQYWLALQIQGSQGICSEDSSPDFVRYYSGFTYGDPFPTIWSGITTDNNAVGNLRMIYSSTSTTSTSTTTTSTSTSTSSTSSTTSTSTSTSTSSTTTILAVNPLSLGGVFITSFQVIPYFAYGLLILAFGISWRGSKNIPMSLLFTGLISIALTYINAIDVSVPATILILAIFGLAYNMRRYSQGSGGSSYGGSGGFVLGNILKRA